MKNIDTLQTGWNLKPLFKNDHDPQINQNLEKVKEVSYKFIRKWKKREDYLEDPKILKQALDEYATWERDYGTSGTAGYYFWLRTKLDQNDPALRAKSNKIRDIALQIENDIQFFTHRLSKVQKDKQKEFLTSKELIPYRHFLKKLFEEAKYLLSEDEEKIVNLIMPVSHSNWVRMLSSFLSKEERVVLNEKGNEETKNFSEIISLVSDKNKEVRDRANMAFNDILNFHLDEAEVELNAVLELKKVDDQIRKIGRPDLSRHLADDIETEVVDSLLEAVTSRYDISERFYKLKAKLLGVKKLEYHERNVEVGEIEGSYSWDKTVFLVNKVFSSLDGEFQSIFSDFLEKGQIDVFPKKGKSDGAFCVSVLPSLPVYVLLNHNNKLEDVTTLAHEMGHAINDTLIFKKQNALNSSTPTSTAEVASTFMEDFVIEEITKEADDETKLALMMKKLGSDVSSIQRQVACYKFEQDLHTAFREKGYLSKEEIGKMFQKRMSEYMGNTVAQSMGSENWWVYWSHIRRFFYVYSYASGLLISKSLQGFVRDDPEFIEKVKDFLAAGSSDSPKNIFKKLGIDIRDKKFWNKGLSEMDELLTEAEKLSKRLGKI